MSIAYRVPDYRFILVGAHSEIDSGYAKKVLSIKPPNVDYVEVRIRDRPERVEESKVYLYTSLEPGIGIALGQAMGAGCIPVSICLRLWPHPIRTAAMQYGTTNTPASS